MKHTLAFIASVLLLTICGCSDTAERRQIVGTWFQNTHTLTLASDGSYTSTFPDFPKGHTTTYDGRWSIEWGRLAFTGVHSNSISVSDVSSSKIVSLDDHSLVLDIGTQKISLSR
jgi:hypothetical protein